MQKLALDLQAVHGLVLIEVRYDLQVQGEFLHPLPEDSYGSIHEGLYLFLSLA